MKLSQLLGVRYKEKPSEAKLISHALLLRGGYIHQVSNGIYSLLPPAKRIIRKIERIIREEMDRIDGQEVLMPVVQPRELWDQSGRYGIIGSEMARFRDRTGHDMVLAMTHEEATVDLCRNVVSSYTQLPFMVYQIQTKFRDEPRSRGGLIRVREFTMKDAYSFHRTQEDLESYYERCYGAYERIFARAGIPEVVAIQSDTGMMGGRIAHEFMLLCEAGEDTVVVCDHCDYRANLEVAETKTGCTQTDEQLPVEKVHTPGFKTIEEVSTFLGVPKSALAKAVFYATGSEPAVACLLLRGDREVAESKLGRLLGCQPVLAETDAVSRAGFVAGFAGPIGVDTTKCRIYVDKSLVGCRNLVCGANETDYHLRNFNPERDLPEHTIVSVSEVQEGDTCPSCAAGKLNFTRGIEVGNIFQLGTKYTEAMRMSYIDEEGRSAAPIMGCYGIGVGRLLSSVVEAKHDDYGPKWPISIAPWEVNIVGLNTNKEPVRAACESLYADLLARGVEVLYDDREGSPGAKFADADLLGVPIRLIVSERNLAKGAVEWKRRDTGEQGSVPIDEAAAFVVETVKKAHEALAAR